MRNPIELVALSKFEQYAMQNTYIWNMPSNSYCQKIMEYTREKTEWSSLEVLLWYGH